MIVCLQNGIDRRQIVFVTLYIVSFKIAILMFGFLS